MRRSISFKTTSLCQAQCKNCTVKPWMNKHRDYHMSIWDVKEFMYYSEKAGFVWDTVFLSGGEPLLWKNVVECAKMLKESGVVGKLVMFTNGMVVTEKSLWWVRVLLRYLDEFRVAQYVGNEEHVQFIKDNLDPSNIIIQDKTRHMVPPAQPIDSSRPSDCGCDAFCYFDGWIDLCGPARSICYQRNVEFTYSWKPKTFFDRIVNDLPDHTMQTACKMCIANRKVSKYLKTEENRVPWTPSKQLG